MGNMQSGGESKKFLKDIRKSAKKNINIVSAIDLIATKFILESSFQDMLKLQDKKYCDKLTILTKKVIEKNLTPKETVLLDFRTKNGQLVKHLTREHFSFIDGNKFNTFDIKSKVKKERVCLGIARFYVSFFHLFASIVKAINPVYTYKDSSGKIQQIDLLDKLDIPPGQKKQRKLFGICRQKFINLSPIQNNDNATIVVPKFCKMTSEPLCDQPGIKELKYLYYDEYDYDPASPTAGTYYRMSTKMKEIYKKDVHSFYKAFSGETVVPEGINDFCDIYTFDFSRLVTCKDNEKHFSYKGTKNDVSIKNYGKQLNEMMISTSENQKKLLTIIDKMFSFQVNIDKKVKELSINPILNNESLKDLITETREIIVKMFINCENNYKKSINLFRAITVDKALVRDRSRINMHKKKEEEIIMQHNIIEPEIRSEHSTIVPSIQEKTSSLEERIELRKNLPIQPENLESSKSKDMVWI